ncbi:MAG: hypothetical protein ROO76_15935 [Terriglobia bacterium]|nr:hypothetical protein [Terriglobia bacterium]
MLCTLVAGQGDPLPLGGNNDQSLGQVAKQKPSSAVHAKKVLTDDDPSIHRLGIPQISLDNISNAEEIAQAILAHSSHHTPQETESVVKDWYDDEMDEIAHARSEIGRATSKPKPVMIDNPDDYEKSMRQYREQQEVEAQRTATRELVVRSRNDVIHKIHDRLAAVRTSIQTRGLSYKWFDTNFPYVIYYGPAE